MSKISELIASLLARSTTEGLMAEEYGANNHRVTKAEAATDTATKAIVDPWNAAEKAMRAIEPLLILVTDTAQDAYRFYEMDDPLGVFLEECLPHIDTAQIEDALALMDDNSHSQSRDEAMVEDKRYERDDIYKK